MSALPNPLDTLADELRRLVDVGVRGEAQHGSDAMRDYYKGCQAGLAMALDEIEKLKREIAAIEDEHEGRVYGPKE